MGFGAFFRSAVFHEPVMVWSLMMYGAGKRPSSIDLHGAYVHTVALTLAQIGVPALSIAVATPNIRPYFTQEKPKAPPSLKEVGFQECMIVLMIGF